MCEDVELYKEGTLSNALILCAERERAMKGFVWFGNLSSDGWNKG